MKQINETGRYITQIAIFCSFISAKITAQPTHWKETSSYISHETIYSLELFKAPAEVWEARVIIHNILTNYLDTTVLDIQNDLGMLLGDFTFETHYGKILLKYVFVHHNVTIVTQIFNISSRNPEPIHFYWYNKDSL